jgi:anti-sigma B factor antagonist
VAKPGEPEITVEPLDSEGMLVRVRGELDLASAPDLETALGQAAEASATSVTLDLTECTFIDSATLRVILAGATRVEASGGTLSLVAPEHGVRRVLEIADVGARVTIRETLETPRD